MNSWILISLRVPLENYDPKTYRSDELEADLPTSFYEIQQRLISTFERELEAKLDRSELDYYSPIMDYHFDTELRADEVRRRLEEIPALAEFASAVDMVEDMSPEHEYALELEQIELELAQAQAEMEERAARWEAQDAEVAARIGQRDPIQVVDETAQHIGKPKATRRRPTGPSKPGSSFGL